MLVPETPWIIAGGIGAATLALRHGRHCRASGGLLALPLTAIACGTLLLLAGRPGTAMGIFVLASVLAIFFLTRLPIASPAKRWAIVWIAIAVVLTVLDPSQIPT